MPCVKRRVIFIKMSSELYNISKIVLVALFVAIAVVGNVQNMNNVQQCTMIRAATCDFQQCGILTSVHSDEPVQLPFKLINSKCCSVSSLIIIEYASDWQRL